MIRDDIFVHLINMPVKSAEAVCQNEDGSYTIFINARLSYEKQLLAYNHAINHIQEDDFSKDDIQTIEYSAHKEPAALIGPNPAIPANQYLNEIQKIKRERRRIQKKLRQYEEKMTFLQQAGFDNFFEQAEYHYLYGKDL